MKQLKRNWFLQNRPWLTCHRPRSLPPDQISKHLPREKLLLKSPEKTARKKEIVDKASKKKKPPANKKTEGDKSEETRSKAKEKQAKQSAEVESRKSLAAQFFKAVSPSENLDNFTNEDNRHENGLMTAEHDVTFTATKLPRFNDKRDQNRQSTPEAKSCGVTDTVQKYQSDQLRNDIVAPQENVGLTTSTDTQLNNHLTRNTYISAISYSQFPSRAGQNSLSLSKPG